MLEPPPELPPYLRNTDPLELDQLPLQVALLTMELARLYERMEAASTFLEEAAAQLANPAGMRLDDA